MIFPGMIIPDPSWPKVCLDLRRIPPIIIHYHNATTIIISAISISTKILSTLARQVQVLPIDKARLGNSKSMGGERRCFFSLEGEWWNRGCRCLIFFLTLWDFRFLFPTCSSKPRWAQRGYSWHASRSQCHGPQKRAPQTSSCSREVCAMQSRDCTSIREAFLDALDKQLEGIVSAVQPDS